VGFIMHFAFDNTRRLMRKVYYFRYTGIVFKLIQSDPRRFSDVLLTNVSAVGATDEQLAYAAASQFLSALSWENGSQIAMRHGGGYGASDNLCLRSAQCGIKDLPEVPGGFSRMKGYGIGRIPKIVTPEQSTALTLFRDGNSSNHMYLRFLLFSQVLETAGASPWDVATELYKKYYKELHTKSAFDQLSLGSRKIGDYLREDCRNAIAHFIRPSKRTTVRLDVVSDYRRIQIGAAVIRELAIYHIRFNLALQDHLFLMKCHGIPYPQYVDEDYIKAHRCEIAYPKKGKYKKESNKSLELSP